MILVGALAQREHSFRESARENDTGALSSMMRSTVELLERMKSMDHQPTEQWHKCRQDLETSTAVGLYDLGEYPLPAEIPARICASSWRLFDKQLTFWQHLTTAANYMRTSKIVCSLPTAARPRDYATARKGMYSSATAPQTSRLGRLVLHSV